MARSFRYLILQGGQNLVEEELAGGAQMLTHILSSRGAFKSTVAASPVGAPAGVFQKVNEVARGGIASALTEETPHFANYAVDSHKRVFIRQEVWPYRWYKVPNPHDPFLVRYVARLDAAHRMKVGGAWLLYF